MQGDWDGIYVLKERELVRPAGKPSIFSRYDLVEFSTAKFEILSEEDEEIDIQSIEKLEYETTIEILGACDCWNGNELYCLKTFSKNDENLLKSNAENHKKINELLKALKQLDKKIKEK